jgi:hypothetical protein
MPLLYIKNLPTCNKHRCLIMQIFNYSKMQMLLVGPVSVSSIMPLLVHKYSYLLYGWFPCVSPAGRAVRPPPPRFLPDSMTKGTYIMTKRIPTKRTSRRTKGIKDRTYNDKTYNNKTYNNKTYNDNTYNVTKRIWTKGLKRHKV